MADQELFKMNAYGDIWQEPQLFDQPEAPTISAEERAERLAALIEEAPEPEESYLFGPDYA